MMVWRGHGSFFRHVMSCHGINIAGQIHKKKAIFYCCESPAWQVIQPLSGLDSDIKLSHACEGILTHPTLDVTPAVSMIPRAILAMGRMVACK